MESSQRDLRRGHAGGFVELETQRHSGFILGTVGVGTFALALRELCGKPVARRVPELQDFTGARHHDPKLRLEPDIVLLAQEP
jgi:hypothetical protein